jgi:hypothetical protein
VKKYDAISIGSGHNALIRIALLQAIGRTINRTARITEVVVDKAEARAKAG